MSEAVAEELDEVSDLPSEETLRRILKDFSLPHEESKEALSQMGHVVKNAEKDHNIHRGAFKQTARLVKMDETKRSEFLTHFLHYIEVLGLEPHPDLFEEERDEDMAEADAAVLKRNEKSLKVVQTEDA